MTLVKRETKLSRAKQLLMEQLSTGEKARSELANMAVSMGISVSILDRARIDLGLHTRAIYQTGKRGSTGNYWSLPSAVGSEKSPAHFKARIESLDKQAPGVNFLISIANKADIAETALRLFLKKKVKLSPSSIMKLEKVVSYFESHIQQIIEWDLATRNKLKSNFRSMEADRVCSA